MHPTKKAARIAGAIYLSMVFTAPFTLIYVPDKLFVRLHDQGIFMNELFWGLWLFPFGLLVYRSEFMPRWLGVWLMINCFGYVILCGIALLFPAYYNAAFLWAQPILFGELAIMLY